MWIKQKDPQEVGFRGLLDPVDDVAVVVLPGLRRQVAAYERHNVFQLREYRKVCRLPH